MHEKPEHEICDLCKPSFTLLLLWALFFLLNLNYLQECVCRILKTLNNAQDCSVSSRCVGKGLSVWGGSCLLYKQDPVFTQTRNMWQNVAQRLTVLQWIRLLWYWLLLITKFQALGRVSWMHPVEVHSFFLKSKTSGVCNIRYCAINKLPIINLGK